ncbi:MAG: insulinase family protein [Ignavibacteriae bacterium]|nr:insulinase family protein [Ignavibacteriota bacterium]
MRFLLYLMLCLVPLALVIARGPDENNKIFPYPINQVTLDNGLIVISIPFDSPGIIAVYTVVRAGSRNEVEPGKSGFAHFFEHMMFRGTEKYSKDAYNEMLKSIGADNNAFTTDDYTAYHTLASSDVLETLLDIESDRFMNLKYTEEDFKTEAGAILGEYNKNYSNPDMTIYEKLRENAFKKHTYKHTTMGFLKDIQDMPNQYQYSLTFFDRWYRPENCALIVVGDFNQTKLMELVKKYYSNWKRGTYTLDVPLDVPQTEEKTLNLPWKAQTLPQVSMGYRGPAFNDTEIDMPAMDVLSQVLFSETSDLFQKLVIEEQLVEYIYGGQQDHRDPELFMVDARVKEKANIERVRAEIDKAIEQSKTTPVSAERLASIKSHMKYQFAMGLDNPNGIARTISHYVQLTGNPESVNNIYSLYEKITVEDLMNVAKKYLNKKNRTTVIMTQEEGQQ